MDRSKYTTLCTYSTWIQTSRIQDIYHFQILKYIETSFGEIHSRQTLFHTKSTLEMVDNIAYPAGRPHLLAEFDCVYTTCVHSGTVNAESKLFVTIH